MLLNNYSVLNSSPGRAIGNFTNLYSNYKPGGWYSMYVCDCPSTKMNSASIPTGTQPPYSWILAKKAGELSSTTSVYGIGDSSISLSTAISIFSSLSGAGTLQDSLLSLITALNSVLSGAGALTASARLAVKMAASLGGGGNITGALKLISGIVANVGGSGNVNGNLKGKLKMQSDIYVNAGTATLEEQVAAIWNAMASQYNNAGTMGQKLNSAGTAGDPWTTDLTAYNTEGTAGKKMKDALTQDDFMALK